MLRSWSTCSTHCARSAAYRLARASSLPTRATRCAGTTVVVGAGICGGAKAYEGRPDTSVAGGKNAFALGPLWCAEREEGEGAWTLATVCMTVNP